LKIEKILLYVKKKTRDDKNKKEGQAEVQDDSLMCHIAPVPLT